MVRLPSRQGDPYILRATNQSNRHPDVFRLATIVVAVALLATACSSGKGSTTSSAKVTSNLVQELSNPAIIAHRGGPLANPEESLEAFRAAASAGFPLEMDLRPLGDGTLVPSHDRTVDRTMIGASGKLSSLTRRQWDDLQIRSVGQGAVGTPSTWNELVDTFGGKVLLVPQIDEQGEVLNGFIKTVKERDLAEAVVVQSWSLETSTTVAKAGLHALQLVEAKQTVDPQALVTEGIEYVGLSSSADKAYMQKLKDKGLKVWVYTVNDVNKARAQFARGADGIFTDDPWHMRDAFTK